MLLHRSSFPSPVWAHSPPLRALLATLDVRGGAVGVDAVGSMAWLAEKLRDKAVDVHFRDDIERSMVKSQFQKSAGGIVLYSLKFESWLCCCG